MQARIHTKDGDFALARAALKQYTGGEKELQERDALLQDIADAEAGAKQAAQERGAQLWNACVESASRALRISTHSTTVRTLRVECALGAGDIEGAVGDMRCASSLHYFRRH
jgi:DnaJ family protein C protein 3